LRTLLSSIVFVLLALTAAACGSPPVTPPIDPATAVGALPEGDPARGEDLFAQPIDTAPACTSCHVLTDQRIAGPGMEGYGARAGNTVEGQTAAAYSYMAIVHPGAYIVEGYNNLMWSQYGERLSDQQLADLIAYMLEQ